MKSSPPDDVLGVGVLLYFFLDSVRTVQQELVRRVYRSRSTNSIVEVALVQQQVVII